MLLTLQQHYGEHMTVAIVIVVVAIACYGNLIPIAVAQVCGTRYGIRQPMSNVTARRMFCLGNTSLNLVAVHTNIYDALRMQT